MLVFHFIFFVYDTKNKELDCGFLDFGTVGDMIIKFV